MQPPTQNAQATSEIVNIGSRKSVLALVQTEMVHKALREVWPNLKYEIHAMSTMGDKNQITPLHDFGAKSLWTHELENLLLEGKLDMIVHSLKGPSDSTTQESWSSREHRPADVIE